MSTDKKPVLYESDEAASLQTVTGWVSRTGHFWGKDEHMARYDGSTHRTCSQNPAHGVVETHGWCRMCRDERMDAKFAAMPRRAYDGEPVAVFDGDTYFFDAESIADWLVDNDIEPEDARLVFCKPNMASEIDPYEHFRDDLPEDGEVSDRLMAAFDALNAAIRDEPPLSWYPGEEAVILPGKHAVAAGLGIEAKAKASAGGAIVLTHRNDYGDLICIRAAMVGQDGIKPDVWYELNADGEFVECEV